MQDRNSANGIDRIELSFFVKAAINQRENFYQFLWYNIELSSHCSRRDNLPGFLHHAVVIIAVDPKYGHLCVEMKLMM